MALYAFQLLACLASRKTYIPQSIGGCWQGCSSFDVKSQNEKCPKTFDTNYVVSRVSNPRTKYISVSKPGKCRVPLVEGLKLKDKEACRPVDQSEFSREETNILPGNEAVHVASWRFLEIFLVSGTIRKAYHDKFPFPNSSRMNNGINNSIQNAKWRDNAALGCMPMYKRV
ncbi:predicted protein [Sclerotinia sclerotiorum 1980 UF-70]|uniref:Uncharacterized protein n=1 Tax=Sclerotinia sclerotiorum (strain ATCC 18683 / 1980 / Ss-1) TaxID=665079 RepID=A7EL89_SCLS1|nr:predicted protein [Sclerotinia sclerotiorum 1980 UF-70]EDO03605.1 predicted protein [Sclerotinia sclerotiorum 1980 UF-70]